MGDTLHFVPAGIIAKSSNYYILLCVDDGSWWMGKVKTYSPKAKKFNFTIQWGTDGTAYSQMLQLTNYFIPDIEESPAVAGNWLYILSSRRASTRRPREEQAGDEEEEEESKSGDEGDDDDDDDDDEQEQATPPSRSRMRTDAGSGSGGGGGGGRG